MTILQANAAAALNKKKISSGDKKRPEQYAKKTAPGYCTGCSVLATFIFLNFISTCILFLLCHITK